MPMNLKGVDGAITHVLYKICRGSTVEAHAKNTVKVACELDLYLVQTNR